MSGTQSSEVMYITEKFHRRCPDSSVSVHRLFPSKVIGIVRKEMPLPPLRLMHLNTWVPVGDALGEGCGTLKR